MNPARATLVAVILLGIATLGVVLTIPEPPGGHGAPHAGHATMLVAPAQRTFPIGITAVATFLGVVQLVLFVGMIAWGLASHERARTEARPWLIGIGVVWIGSFLGMMAAQHQLMSAGTTGLVLGFPWPTAVMLFAVLTIPHLLTILYAWKFEDWIHSPEDEARFQQWLTDRETTP